MSRVILYAKCGIYDRLDGQRLICHGWPGSSN